MKKLRKMLGSFRFKVTTWFMLALFFVMGLSNFLIYQFSLQEQFKQLRSRLMMIAQTAALMVDGDAITQVPLNREGTNSQAYKQIAEKLKKIKDANPTLKYIYTMSKTGQEGVLQFIVDPEPGSELKRSGLPTSFPGDKYNAVRVPSLLAGFNAPSADKTLVKDEWGVTLSGYAPIRSKAGNAVAVLGIDMDAKDVYIAQREIHRRALFVFFIGIVFCFIIGMYLSSLVTSRIQQLANATRRLATDDLNHQVVVKGDDEIGELARSFNNMARNLFQARSRLRDYFYRVVQVLVNMLEAKDVYTRGHSERVAEYTEKIALALNYSKEDALTIKKVAQLHDIGKLLIHESILNKKEKLTEEEWSAIKEHPVTGEQILKPVMLDELLLSMVRSHHERVDGNGYPDKLTNGEINMFAQIITVADSYDAMTSDRAYRPMMSKEQAIEELKKNSGSQFNPKIVDVFINKVIG